jgi:hypothetical protein
MKKISFYVFLFLMICEVGFAEQYVCSADLTRYNRPGEIENKLFSRKGNFFYNHRNWKFNIHFENNEEIHLIKETSSYSIFVVIINKKTKEFTEKFLSIEDSRENDNTPLMYGKCVVVG